MSSKKLRTNTLAIITGTLLMCTIGPGALTIFGTRYTMQTVIICFISYQFGWRGLLSVGLYVLSGLAGLPVWAGYTQIPGSFGSAPGFVLGFLVMSASIVFLRAKFGKAFWHIFILLLFAHMILFGFAYGFIYMTKHSAPDLMLWVVDFTPAIVVKCLFTSVIILITRKLHLS